MGIKKRNNDISITKICTEVTTMFNKLPCKKSIKLSNRVCRVLHIKKWSTKTAVGVLEIDSNRNKCKIEYGNTAKHCQLAT
jgi:hypothetical protein